MLEGKFALPGLEGESLLTAVGALMPHPADGEERTASQRRADALARGFLEGSDSPIVG